MESCWKCYDQHFSFKYFCQLCIRMKDFIKIVRPFLASVSINGLNYLHQQYWKTLHSYESNQFFFFESFVNVIIIPKLVDLDYTFGVIEFWFSLITGSWSLFVIRDRQFGKFWENLIWKFTYWYSKGRHLFYALYTDLFWFEIVSFGESESFAK